MSEQLIPTPQETLDQLRKTTDMLESCFDQRMPLTDMQEFNGHFAAELGCALGTQMALFMLINNNGKYLDGYFDDYVEGLKEQVNLVLENVEMRKIKVEEE